MNLKYITDEFNDVKGAQINIKLLKKDKYFRRSSSEWFVKFIKKGRKSLENPAQLVQISKTEMLNIM